MPISRTASAQDSKPPERVIQRRGQHLGGPDQRLPRRAIHRDQITFLEDPAIRGDNLFVLRIKTHIRCTNDTRQPKPAPDHRRMAGHAAAFGQNTRRRMHAANILGRGFAPHQNTGFPPRGARPAPPPR